MNAAPRSDGAAFFAGSFWNQFIGPRVLIFEPSESNRDCGDYNAIVRGTGRMTYRVNVADWSAFGALPNVFLKRSMTIADRYVCYNKIAIGAGPRRKLYETKGFAE
jgi:hypothetical protein